MSGAAPADGATPGALSGLRWLIQLPLLYGRPRTETRYIPQIDGLRALAIAFVFIWHAGLRVVRQIDVLNRSGGHFDNDYGLLPHGEIGVALFFVISGFVIAQPFLSRPRADWRLLRFYRRRLHRIYPPYFIMLVIGLVVVLLTGSSSHAPPDPAHPEPTLLQSFLASALYLHGLVFDASSRLNPPLWSIEVEIAFYAVSPLLLLLYTLSPVRAVRVGAGLAAALAFILAAGLVHAVLPFDGRFRFGLLAHLHLFIVGIVLADLARAQDPLRRPASVGLDLVFVLGLATIVAGGLWLTQVNASPPGGPVYIATQLGLVLATVGIYLGAMGGRFGRYIMSRPWICLSGTACYSIYLTHVGVIQLTDTMVLRHLRLHEPVALWLVWMPVFWIATWTAGLVFYGLVERPFMNRRSS